MGSMTIANPIHAYMKVLSSTKEISMDSVFDRLVKEFLNKSKPKCIENIIKTKFQKINENNNSI